MESKELTENLGEKINTSVHSNSYIACHKKLHKYICVAFHCHFSVPTETHAMRIQNAGV